MFLSACFLTQHKLNDSLYIQYNNLVQMPGTGMRLAKRVMWLLCSYWLQQNTVLCSPQVLG